MRYRVVGFSDNGEARIADESGQVMAYAELYLDADYVLERGDRLDMSVHVTWVRGEDPPAAADPVPDIPDSPDQIDWQSWNG